MACILPASGGAGGAWATARGRGGLPELMGWELPLEVVLGLVAVGVPAVVWLAHLTGGGRVAELTEERVREHLRHDEGVETADVVVGATLSGWPCALARTDQGVWVAWAMESHLAARLVPPGGLRRVAGGLEVSVHDPGWPAVVLTSVPAHPWLEAR